MDREAETCLICGELAEEGLDLCDKHIDDAFTIMTAIMKAKSVDDAVAAWTTWKNGQGRKKTTFLDNCQNCGKLMWIEPWERRNGRYGGKFCSRECSIEAQQKPSKENVTPIIQSEVAIKNPDAVALGRLGGLKGGKARAEKLTPERRSAIASNAVKTRWGKKDKPLELTTNSKCLKCGTRTLERDGTALHCWGCGHVAYGVFSEEALQKQTH